MSSTPRGWLAKADNDLDSVRRAMIPDPSTNNEAAAYLMQQAAEKLLKAALVHEGAPYPRGSGGHDLKVIADRLPAAHPLHAAAQDLAQYTPWANVNRYLDDDPLTATPLPTVAEIEVARKAVMAFRKKLIDLLEQVRPVSH